MLNYKLGFSGIWLIDFSSPHIMEEYILSQRTEIMSFLFFLGEHHKFIKMFILIIFSITSSVMAPSDGPISAKALILSDSQLSFLSKLAFL